MSLNAAAIRRHLSGGPLPARQLKEKSGLSQPTLSRALAGLGNEIVRLGAARSIQYALRDTIRRLPDIPIYRIDTEGCIQLLGKLIAVCAEGYVMQQTDNRALHSEGLPWWLLDIRPQGYLGRAYAARHGVALGLPQRLVDWSDTHALQALLMVGQDVTGNLLLGDIARDRFLAAPTPAPIALSDKAGVYASMALAAASGESPGSSAGGEQPKFTAYAMTPDGPRHVIVKFSEQEEGPVSERWRDLLLAEHLALDTLRREGVPAAKTQIIDQTGQRFLEVERFDRIGSRGRYALFSLMALDAEFVGAGSGPWPLMVERLVEAGHIHRDAATVAGLLWAYGTLIGNSDMHTGNLSFRSAHGRPYDIAPAYDMTPMAFAPRSGGGLPDGLNMATLHASVGHETWRQAERLARTFLARIQREARFSHRFAPCMAALENHIDTAASRIRRLA